MSIRMPLWAKALGLVLVLGTWAHALESLLPAKLPVPPGGSGRFGAYYTQLKYGETWDWDKNWRVGPYADVVVRFDRINARLIFWRGTSYMPCWVNDAGQWYADGGVARPNGDVKGDKLCRYSHATIIESSEARAVIHWKYALVNKDGKLINTDPVTNWNDWVDEFYTIYPDGVAIRRMTLYSSVWDQPISLQQSTAIGDAPGAAAMANPPAANIQLIDSKGMKPFHATMADLTVTPGAKDWAENWPALDSSRIVNSSTWQPSAKAWQRQSWTMMAGLTSAEPEKLVKTVKSWTSAPELSVASGPVTTSGYNRGERAYELACKDPGSPAAVKLSIAASADSPLANIALVVKGWGRTEPVIKVDGAAAGDKARFGFRKTTTVSDLVIWIEKQSEKPVTIEIEPAQAGKDGVK